MSQEDLTINAYYTKFKGLWNDLSDYKTCSCGHQAEECVMSFIMGLNDTYTYCERADPTNGPYSLSKQAIFSLGSR